VDIRLLSLLRSLGERRELPKGVRDKASVENNFRAFVSVSECL